MKLAERLNHPFHRKFTSRAETGGQRNRGATSRLRALILFCGHWRVAFLSLVLISSAVKHRRILTTSLRPVISKKGQITTATRAAVDEAFGFVALCHPSGVSSGTQPFWYTHCCLCFPCLLRHTLAIWPWFQLPSQLLFPQITPIAHPLSPLNSLAASSNNRRFLASNIIYHLARTLLFPVFPQVKNCSKRKKPSIFFFLKAQGEHLAQNRLEANFWGLDMDEWTTSIIYTHGAWWLNSQQPP